MTTGLRSPEGGNIGLLSSTNFPLLLLTKKSCICFPASRVSHIRNRLPTVRLRTVCASDCSTASRHLIIGRTGSRDWPEPASCPSTLGPPDRRFLVPKSFWREPIIDEANFRRDVLI
ncbi:hypothetical protein CISG_01207 [Coccidioides immitis RMSCC 3703]|uniref:Uncharacterized protein n=2 Tax=Coccidioides immitis TaxID=5501 RepID=A0A0J8QUA6_COCIT|nr:hypothetical protein CIRG_01689 [Coccidioides immitis RMSCC 2394]KMU76474.1 hypothetical protein CISG_01207 [Coccidioides immitis RMSCC 3703]